MAMILINDPVPLYAKQGQGTKSQLWREIFQVTGKISSYGVKTHKV